MSGKSGSRETGDEADAIVQVREDRESRRDREKGEQS